LPTVPVRPVLGRASPPPSASLSRILASPFSPYIFSPPLSTGPSAPFLVLFPY